MSAPGQATLQSLVILLCAGLGTLWTFHFHPKRPTLYAAPPAPPAVGIDLAEVLSWNPPPQWIDTRPSAQFEAGHIPGALSLHPGNVEDVLKARFDLFIDQRKRFVLYGPSPANRLIADRLRSLGLTKIEVLKNGWKAWLAHRS